MSVFSSVLTTEYGLIIANPNDMAQYPPLRDSGRSLDHEDIRFLTHLVKLCGEGAVALDIGANYGVFTAALGAQTAKQHGIVISIEAQRILYYMVAGNVALNSLTNVYCYHVAISDQRGRIPIPQYDYCKRGSFGSVQFASTSGDTQQQRLPDNPNEMVETVTLDSFNLDRVDLVKLDIEGMEYQALVGGTKLLTQHKPILWIEWIKSDRELLLQILKSYGYTVYEHGWDWLCMQPDKLPELQKQLTPWPTL